MSKIRRRFTDEFKSRIVKLYENGKPKKDIIKEYNLNPSTFNNWIKIYQKMGVCRRYKTGNPEKYELIELQKENQRLQLENYILKEAALILGRK
ncbi:transposase [Virgibacillus proomii]|uniref:transposase n=1 Tax=Virgibacillus proomii TaxID=84407 RepID=UPI0009855D2B|nr:transposase [Virgibacillus proomii]